MYCQKLHVYYLRLFSKCCLFLKVFLIKILFCVIQLFSSFLFKTGFSTKANAVRHIQKLHVLSKESEIEKYISNNDLCLGLQMEDRDVKNKCRDSISVDSCKTSFSNSNMTSSPSPDKLPPMAHSTPHHSLCPITYYRFGSTPLDLSLKDLELVIHLQSMTNLNGCRSTNCNVMDLSYDDEPLDLGMKKADLSPEISSLDSKQMSSKNQVRLCHIYYAMALHLYICMYTHTHKYICMYLIYISRIVHVTATQSS